MGNFILGYTIVVDNVFVKNAKIDFKIAYYTYPKLNNDYYSTYHTKNNLIPKTILNINIISF